MESENIGIEKAMGTIKEQIEMRIQQESIQVKLSNKQWIPKTSISSFLYSFHQPIEKCELNIFNLQC